MGTVVAGQALYSRGDDGLSLDVQQGAHGTGMVGLDGQDAGGGGQVLLGGDEGGGALVGGHTNVLEDEGTCMKFFFGDG